VWAQSSQSFGDHLLAPIVEGAATYLSFCLVCCVGVGKLLILDICGVRSKI
jgi:hypothetical protein